MFEALRSLHYILSLSVTFISLFVFYIGQYSQLAVKIIMNDLHTITITKLTRLRYWWGIGLVIYKSQVPVLAGHHAVVALGKLLAPVCLCH